MSFSRSILTTNELRKPSTVAQRPYPTSSCSRGSQLIPHGTIWRSRCLGFSFIEIMVVVVIIGLLAGAVAIKVSDYVDKARLNRAKSDIATIVNAVESHYADTGNYPSNDEGLGVLPIKKTTDPWGRPYQYNNPGRDEPYEVICYGADGREGGQDADEDISSQTLEQGD